MKLEDQVTSLELSRKLKELGVKQESFWSWVVGNSKPPFLNDTGTAEIIIEIDAEDNMTSPDLFSAFTVAELGEMLPDDYASYRDDADKRKWFIGNHKKLFNGHYEEANTEADARAKMLIYLIENGLIENEAVNAGYGEP